MDKHYISITTTRTPRPRSERLREQGSGSVNSTVVLNAETGGSSSEGHTHNNKPALDQITTDENGYMWLTTTKEVEVTDPETGEKHTEVQRVTEKVNAGYADKAGSLAEGSPIIEELDGRYLSKINDDEAQEEIGFMKGLWIKFKGLFGFDAEGNLSANEGNFSGRVTANILRSDNYSGDEIADTGWRITNANNGHSKLTIDEIYVRMKAVFESLEVKRWTVSAGDEIRSCAANIINRTEYLDSSGEAVGYSDMRVPWMMRGIPFLLSKFSGTAARKMFAAIRKVRVNLTPEQLSQVKTVRCYFLANDGDTEIQNWWDKDDLVRCQTMNVVNTTRQTYTGTTTHAGNVFWWRKCKGVSSSPIELEQGKKYHYIDIAYDKAAEDAQSASIYCMLGSDIPAAGDHMVQFGNTVIPGRMNLWIQMVNGGGSYDYDPSSDAPCIKGFKGIYTFDLSKCWYGGNPCKMTLAPGKKYEFYGEDFRVIKEYGTVPVPTNRGLWTSITPERDDYTPHGSVRKCYYYDEVSHNGCLWRCSIADGAHWTDASGNHITDAAYDAMTNEQKVTCTRRPNYTTAEPSADSADWVKIVDRGLTPVQIFRWYLSSVTSVPTPSGTTGSAIPPTGWSTSAPNRPGDDATVYNLWMSEGYKDYQNLLVGSWSPPVRISGDKGTAGEDAGDIEWVYRRNNTGTTPSAPANPSDRTIDDYVPDGWTDNPQGVDFYNKYEYASFRQKPKGKNQRWGDFQTPVLWSHWGTNGMDGDGVEYVFMRTTENKAPKISSSQSGYDADEYLPSITNRTSCGAESDKCTDDPKGVYDSNYKYEWAAKRTKGDPDPITGVRSWNKYPTGDMALWANWSDDGATAKKIDKYYQATTQKSAPTAASTSVSGWTLNATPSDWSENKKYLWCQEKTTLTDDSVIWGEVCFDREWARSGDSAVAYSIQTSLDILRVTDTEFTVSIVKTVGGTSTVYSLSNMPSGLSLTTTNGSVNKTSSKVYNMSGLTAGGNVTLTLLDGSTQVAVKSLRVVEGLKGCVVRVTEWKLSTYYRNDDGASWLSGSGTAVGYIDVVWVESPNATNGVNFYQCKAAHNGIQSSNSNKPGNTTYWESVNEAAPIYTSLLIAKNAYIKFGTGNQFVITNSSNQVQAGMKGDGNIRIWAGASPNAGSFDHEGRSNDALVEEAPFRVTADGKLYASKAEISGTFTTLDETVNVFSEGRNYTDLKGLQIKTQKDRQAVVELYSSVFSSHYGGRLEMKYVNSSTDSVTENILVTPSAITINKSSNYLAYLGEDPIGGTLIVYNNNGESTASITGGTGAFVGKAAEVEELRAGKYFTRGKHLVSSSDSVYPSADVNFLICTNTGDTNVYLPSVAKAGQIMWIKSYSDEWCFVYYNGTLINQISKGAGCQFFIYDNSYGWR